MGFHRVSQDGLDKLTSVDPPASASQSTGITGMSHYAQPELFQIQVIAEIFSPTEVWRFCTQISLGDRGLLQWTHLRAEILFKITKEIPNFYKRISGYFSKGTLGGRMLFLLKVHNDKVEASSDLWEFEKKTQKLVCQAWHLALCILHTLFLLIFIKVVIIKNKLIYL